MRKVSALCVVLLLQNSFAWLTTAAAQADPVNLDLSSSTRSVPSSALGSGGAVAIRTGQNVSIINPNGNTLLTPAQFAAAQQVMATGKQTLGVNAAGQAVGGRFSTGLDAQLTGLVIPNGVTMLQNFAPGSVNVTGNLVNSGNIYAFSTNDAVRNAIMNATSIHNLSKGLISSVVPPTVLSAAGVSHSVPNLALTLNASTGIANEGRIVGDGAVSLNTSNVTNSGAISSVHGDVNFDSADNLRLDNTLGSVSAPNGAINFRTPEFTAKKDLNVVGGTLSAPQVNFNTGDGHLKVDVAQIDGAMNITGGTSVVTTHGGTLNIASVHLTGDPAFYNTNGDVSISSDLNFLGQDLAVVASRNINVVGTHNIATFSLSSDGGDVSLIAGADVSSNGGPSTGVNDPTTILSVFGPSASGGSVLFHKSASDLIQTIQTQGGTGFNAGTVNVVAFQGVRGTGGVVDLGGTTINTSGGGAPNTNGNISIIAPGQISVGSIASSSLGASSGNLSILNGQPIVIGGSVDYNNGTQGGTGSYGAPATYSNGGVQIGNVTGNVQSLVVKSGGAISLANVALSNTESDVRLGTQNANINLGGLTASTLNLQIAGATGLVISNGLTSDKGIFIEAPGVQTGFLNATTSGDIIVHATASSMNLGAVTANSGDIELIAKGGIASGTLKTTTSGNVHADAGVGALNSKSVVSAGQVDVRGATVTMSGGVTGSSVMLTSLQQNGPVPLEIVTKPLGTAPFMLPMGNGFTIGGTIQQTNAVDFQLKDNGGFLILNNASTGGQDYVRVAEAFLFPSSGSTLQAPPADITIDTTGGAGGQVLLSAGRTFSTDSPGDLANAKWVQLGGVSSSSGGIGGKAVSVETDKGASVFITSAGGVTGGIHLGKIDTNNQGGTVRISNDQDAIVLIDQAIQVDGPRGGNIVLTSSLVAPFNAVGAVLLSAAALAPNSNGGNVAINVLQGNGDINFSGTKRLEADVRSTVSGNAGSFSLLGYSNSRTFDIDGSRILANGVNGNGGTVRISNGIFGTTRLHGGTLDVSGTTGNGGKVQIDSFGGNTSALALLQISSDINANGSADGGSISISSGGGAAEIGGPSQSLLFTASSGAQGSGGTINFHHFGSVAAPIGTTLHINADGAGYGNGGSINFDVSGYTSPLVFNSNPNSLQFTANGGSAGSVAGNGGSISVNTGSGVNLEQNGVQANALGTNGNGGSISVTAGSTIQLLLTAPIDLSGQGKGNGGSLTLDTPGNVIIDGTYTSKGGTTFGDGGSLTIGSPTVTGLNLTGHSVGQFTSIAHTFDLSASTMGSGGNVSVWADTLVGGMTFRATGIADVPSISGGLDASGGTVVLASKSTIDVGPGFNEFQFDVRGLESGTGSLNFSDGGTVKLFALGGADINVNSGLSLRAKSEAGASSFGKGGFVSLVAAQMPPNHDAFGGFSFDKYGGTVRVFDAPELDGPNFFNNGTLIVEANSLAPVVFRTGVAVLQANTVFVSNLAPGGILVGAPGTNATIVMSDGATAGNINFSASKIVIDNGTSFQITANPSPLGSSVTIATTNSSTARGSIMMSSGTPGTFSFHGGDDTALSVMAGGDLLVQPGGLGDVGKSAHLLLSAGVVSDTLSYPMIESTTFGAPPLITNVNTVNSSLLATQQGRLQVEGSISMVGGDGAQLALISNSPASFSINTGGAVSNGTASSIDITADVAAVKLPNVIVANFGTGGINLPFGGLNYTVATTAGGAPVTPNAFRENALPIPAGAGAGVIEMFAPKGTVFVGQHLVVDGDIASSGNGAPGGTIYIRGNDVQNAGVNTILSAQSNTGDGGGIYVYSNSNLTVGNQNFQTYVNGKSSASSNGNAGTLVLHSLQNLGIDASSVAAAPVGSDGNGANVDFEATNGTLFYVGNLNLSAAAGSTGVAGTARFATGADTFAIDTNSVSITSGITGRVIANDGAGVPGGLITIERTPLIAAPFTVNIGNFGGPLLSPVAMTSPGDLTVNVSGNADFNLASAKAYGGSATVTTNGGTLTVLPNATVYSNFGNVTLNNTDPAGAIVVSNGATIFASAPEFGASVTLAVGSIPVTPTGASTLSGADVRQVNGGTVVITSNVVATNDPTHNIIGSYSGGRVLLSSSGTGTISINGAGDKTSIQSASLENLDLTSGSNLNYLESLVTNGVLQGDLSTPGQYTLTIPEYISTRAIKFLNVPAGDQLVFSNITKANPMTIVSPIANGTNVVTVDGAVLFDGTTDGTMRFFPGMNGSILLSMGAGSSITSFGDLNLEVFGANGPSITMSPANGPNRAALLSSSSGNVNVYTTSQATFGDILAKDVSLTVTNGNLLSASGASIAANKVDLMVENGGVGTSTAPLNVVLSDALRNEFSVNVKSLTVTDVFVNTFAQQVRPVDVSVSPASVASVNITSDGSMFVNDVVSTLSSNFTTTNGFLGTIDRPVISDAPNQQFHASGVNGAVNAASNRFDTVNLLNSTAESAFNYSTFAILTMHDVDVTNGNINVHAPSLIVAPNSTIIAENGTIDLSADQGVGTAIRIGDNALIASIGQTGGSGVRIYLGGTFLPASNPVGGQLNVNLNGVTSAIYFGDNGITANGVNNSVYVTGGSSAVVFNTQTDPASSIVLDGNARIVSADNLGVAIRLTSFDLTDSNVLTNISTLQSAGLIGGSSTATAVLRPVNFAPTLTAFNVAGGNFPTFEAFSASTPVIVTGSSATIDGQLSMPAGSTLDLRVMGSNSSFNMNFGFLFSKESVSITADNVSLANAFVLPDKNLVFNTADFKIEGFSAVKAGGDLLIENKSGVLRVHQDDPGVSAVLGARNAIWRGVGTLDVGLATGATLTSVGNLVLQSGTVQVTGAGQLNVNGSAEINAPTALNVSSIHARELVVNSPTGIGTLMNPNGDFVLTSSIKTNGQSLAILASGNVLATSKVTSIDLSNKNALVNNGQGGSLTIIAGYNFDGALTNQTPLLGTFTIGDATDAGGSILLPTTKITTASTLTAGAILGGDVTLVAHGGTVNAGSIIVSDITTLSNAKAGSGGSVTAIGGGGIITGNITATGGATGGGVNLYSDQPTIFGGTVQIVDGALRGTGVFTPSPDARTASGAPVKTGAINTSSVLGAAGNVIIGASTGVTSGAIKAQGFKDVAPVGAPGIALVAPGSVTINSPFGAVSTGAITTSALAGTKTSGNGASGNSIEIKGTSIAIGGNIDTHGATAMAPNGVGGQGGFVDLSTPIQNPGDPLPQQIRYGSIAVKGGITTYGGGNTKGATGLSGDGGKVDLGAGTVTVGTVGGISVNSAPGAGINPGLPGPVGVDTYAIQNLPTALDLTSKTASVAAFPGGLFTLGIGAPLNGFAGSIKTNVLITKKEFNGNGLLMADPSGFADFTNGVGAVINVEVHGTPTQDIVLTDSTVKTIAVADNKGKRTLIQPVLAAGLFLTTHGQPQAGVFNISPDLTLAPFSALKVQQTDLPTAFTAFKLPTGTTLNLYGPQNLLKLPATTVMNGRITFLDPGIHTIDFGAGSPVINGGINLPGSGTLVLAGTGAKITVQSLLQAPYVVLARASAAPLTFVTTGGAGNGVDANILLSRAANPSLAVNFVTTGADFLQAPPESVEFGTVPLNTLANAVALNAAKLATVAPAAKISFALIDATGATITPKVTGNVTVGSMTMTGLVASTKVAGVTVKQNTGIQIEVGADLRANNNFTITTAGPLTVSGSLTAGVAAANINPFGTIAPSMITSKGALTLTANSGAVLLDLGSRLTANGGNVTVVQKLAIQDTIVSGTQLTANGGNVIVLSAGNILNNPNGPFVLARAMGTKAADQKGGGIEFGAGTTTSQLAKTFTLAPGTVPGPNPVLGNATINNMLGATAHGAVQLIAKNGGGVTIGPGYTIDVTKGGAVLFQADKGKQINWGGGFMSTSAFKPIAYHPSAAGFDAVLNPDEDTAIGTAYGDIEIRKGAVVSVSREHNGVRITALSGPGDVVIRSGGQKVLVAPGHEVLLTNAEAEAELAKSDGVGRRNTSRVVLTNGVVVHRCEVSLVSFMAKAGVQDKAIRDKMLKTAAAVYVVSGAKHGAYSARR